MSFSIKLIESNKEITEKINSAMISRFASIINKRGKPKLLKSLYEKIPDWILEQDEIASLNKEGVFYELNAELGLFPGQGAIATDAIIQSVISSVNAAINFPKGESIATIEFFVQPSSLSNLLSLKEGFLRTGKHNMHWLRWLLTLGTATIVMGYQYKPDTYGRGGGGVMIKGSTWRIDPRYAGTQTDNFITRALSNREQEITQMFKEALND